MEDYLIKKGDYKFSNILSKGYEFDEQPVVLNKSTKADGSIKVVYAQYTTLSIAIKLGQLDGTTIKEYSDNFTDGQYIVWNPNTRSYKTYNFIVTKNAKNLIYSKDGEKYAEFDIVLEKSSEVVE